MRKVRLTAVLACVGLILVSCEKLSPEQQIAALEGVYGVASAEEITFAGMGTAFNPCVQRMEIRVEDNDNVKIDGFWTTTGHRVGLNVRVDGCHIENEKDTLDYTFSIIRREVSLERITFTYRAEGVRKDSRGKFSKVTIRGKSDGRRTGK